MQERIEAAIGGPVECEADAVRLPGLVPRRKGVSVRDWNPCAERNLEEWLSSAMLVSDKELRGLVDQVDEISAALSSDASEECVKIARHPAVWRALRQAIIERELRYLALTDDLTCLYNRRGFFAAATQQLKVALRQGRGILLFFCDVDDLKYINDTYGHQEGDLALVRTADALEQAFRDSDLLARLGGDEFAALAVDAENEGEQTILGRLEDSLRNSGHDEATVKLSLSVGVARFDPKKPATLGELMAEADRAMYEQKRKGKKEWPVKH